MRNVKRLRDFMNVIIDQRKEELKDPVNKSKGDLLTTLLQIDMF